MVFDIYQVIIKVWKVNLGHRKTEGQMCLTAKTQCCRSFSPLGTLHRTKTISRTGMSKADCHQSDQGPEAADNSRNWW